MGLCSGDVFDGGLYAWWIGWFKDIRTPTWVVPALLHGVPPPELLEQARKRVQILSFEHSAHDPRDMYAKTISATMRDDGFEHVVPLFSASDELMQANWFDQMLTLLENGGAAAPATEPTTAPTEDDAQHLLNLAQMYIANQQTDKARDELNQLIQQYPDDPAAQKAQDMLNQIQGQP